MVGSLSLVTETETLKTHDHCLVGNRFCSQEIKMQLAQARNEFYASNQDNEEQALSNLLGAWKNKKLNGKTIAKTSTSFSMPCVSKQRDESMIFGVKRFNWNE